MRASFNLKAPPEPYALAEQSEAKEGEMSAWKKQYAAGGSPLIVKMTSRGQTPPTTKARVVLQPLRT